MISPARILDRFARSAAGVKIARELETEERTQRERLEARRDALFEERAAGIPSALAEANATKQAFDDALAAALGPLQASANAAHGRLQAARSLHSLEIRKLESELEKSAP